MVPTHVDGNSGVNTMWLRGETTCSQNVAGLACSVFAAPRVSDGLG